MKPIRTVTLLILAITGAPFVGLAGEKTHDMARVVQHHIDHGFWGVVRVSRGTTLQLERASGRIRVGHDGLLIPGHRFLIGSVTKQFTAAAILQLEEQGKISLSDKLSKYLPRAPHADEVTIEQMLRHTSGLANYTNETDFWAKFYNKPSKLEDLLGLIAAKPLDFAPGTRWNYSNTGYVLAGAVVEKLSGQDLGTYFKAHFFDPLEMKDTCYELSFDPSKIVQGHNTDDSYGPSISPFSGDISWAAAAGAIYSTASDLVKWNQGLETGRVIQASSLAKMRTPGLEDYGLGIISLQRDKYTWLEHAGGLPGFQSYLAYKSVKDAPATEGVSVAIVSNFMNGLSDLLSKDLRTLLMTGEVELHDFPMPVDITPAQRARLIGTYILPGNIEMVVSEEDGKLRLQVAGQPRWLMLAHSESRFYLGSLGIELEFTLPAGGGLAPSVLVRQNGEEERAMRKP